MCNTYKAIKAGYNLACAIMLITYEIGDMKGCNRCAHEKGVDMALDRQFSHQTSCTDMI